MTKPGLRCTATLLLLLPLFFLHPYSAISHQVLDLSYLNDGGVEVLAKSSGAQKIGECLDELDMDSDSNRRLLMMQRRYISYETLMSEMTPCGTTGASYYDCYGRAAASPYDRGCEVITRCARDAQNLRN